MNEIQTVLLSAEFSRNSHAENDENKQGISLVQRFKGFTSSTSKNSHFISIAEIAET